MISSFANGFGSYLESDSRKSNDSFAWGGQLGMSGTLAGINLMGGVSYYSIEAAGKSTTFGDPSDPGDFFGNTAIQPGGLPCGTIADVECVYAYDYLLTEVFAEAKFELGEIPVTLYGDFVTNGDVSENDTGWTLGAKVGQAKDRGQWQFTYLLLRKRKPTRCSAWSPIPISAVVAPTARVTGYRLTGVSTRTGYAGRAVFHQRRRSGQRIVKRL